MSLIIGRRGQHEVPTGIFCNLQTGRTHRRFSVEANEPTARKMCRTSDDDVLRISRLFFKP